MKTKITLLSLLFPFLNFAQINFSEHKWIGHTQFLGQTFITEIIPKGDTVNLKFTSASGVEKYVCEKVKQTGNEVLFNFRKNGKLWKYTGEISVENKLHGAFEINELTAKCQLFQRLVISKNEWQPLLGNYILPSGGILRVWETGNYLRYHSVLTRQSGLLRKIGDGRFFSTTGEQLLFSNLSENKYQELTWYSPDGQSISAIRTDEYIIEEHLIVTSKDTIGASLYLPKKNGKYPACILARGAGRYDRSLNAMEAELFSSHGIAALIYDNYGTEKSNGNLMEKDFEDKQMLVVELYNWLKKHPNIYPDKIGFRGGSQGGRVALMAASEIPETAFLIMAATPLETRLDQQLFALSQFNRQQNFSEKAIAQSSELWRQYFLLAKNQKADASFQNSLNAFRKKHPHIALPEVEPGTPPYYPWSDDILSDGRDYLPKIKCPVLAIYGSNDDRVPAQKSAAQIESGLIENGNDDLEIIFYEGANHSFMLPGFRIAPGLFLDQIEWVLGKI